MDWNRLAQGLIRGTVLALDIGGRMCDPFPVGELREKFREHFGQDWKPREPDAEGKGVRVWFFPGCRYVAQRGQTVYFYRKPGTGPTKMTRITDALGELLGHRAKSPAQGE